MQYVLSPRIVLIIGLLGLAAGFMVQFYFTSHDKLSSFLIAFGATIVAVSLGRTLFRKRAN